VNQKSNYDRYKEVISAKEFDYVGLHEDKSIDVENPDKNPTKIGFVKRTRKDNPDSTFQK
jgi:hypothetical protein